MRILDETHIYQDEDKEQTLISTGSNSFKQHLTQSSCTRTSIQRVFAGFPYTMNKFFFLFDHLMVLKHLCLWPLTSGLFQNDLSCDFIKSSRLMSKSGDFAKVTILNNCVIYLFQYYYFLTKQRCSSAKLPILQQKVREFWPKSHSVVSIVIYDKYFMTKMCFLWKSCNIMIFGHEIVILCRKVTIFQKLIFYNKIML